MPGNWKASFFDMLFAVTGHDLEVPSNKRLYRVCKTMMQTDCSGSRTTLAENLSFLVSWYGTRSRAQVGEAVVPRTWCCVLL